MERTPEPEIMDEPTQARAYAEADFEEANSAFVAYFRARFPQAPSDARALDMGCGPADITLRMATTFPGWHCVGVDGSDAMLEHGRAARARLGLEDRVDLVCGRIPEAPLPPGPYDVLFSNSLLHHLPDGAILWNTIRTWGRAGSRVLVMDLMRPMDEAAAHHMVKEYSDDEPEVLKRDFFASLLAAYRPDEIRAQLSAAGLGDLTVEVVSDRHVLVHGVLQSVA